MYDRFELDVYMRRAVIDSLYESLMYDWNIPPHIRDHYGLTEDYLLYHRLYSMDSGEYRQKRQHGEVPDMLEVDARLTHRAEEIFERLCPHLPADYLDKLDRELEKLGRIAASPDDVHDLHHFRLDFLTKYGIDKRASPKEVAARAEKAYRELDARFVRMTGRRPYADEFFSSLRSRTGNGTKEERPKPARRPILRHPPFKGRKMSF